MSAGIIARRIIVMRGHKALLDADLAVLYGVTTKRLNQQVRAERDEVVANCDHLAKLKFSPTMPYAFTEDTEH